MSGQPPPQPPIGVIVQRLLSDSKRFRESGKWPEAAAFLRQAAAFKPNDAFIAHDYGLTCLHAALFSEAVTAFEKATTIDPSFASAFWRLGVTLNRLRQDERAIEVLRRAVELDPELFDAHFLLAQLLENYGHRAEAIARYQSCRHSSTSFSLRQMATIRIAIARNQDEDADTELRKLLKSTPKNATAWALLGKLLTEDARFEEAADCFESALRYAPAMIGVYYDLVRCRRITDIDSELVERMRLALTQFECCDALPAVRLRLALGKALDDLGQYGEAMRVFDAADVIRSQVTGFDPSRFEKKVDHIIESFSPELMAQVSSSDHEEAVFILGMPRSGTTLCEQILSAHPEVLAGGELHFWGQRGSRLDLSRLGRIQDEFFVKTGIDYLDHLRDAVGHAKRVTDKMPFNFLWIGFIHLALPHAKIIHCMRNPADVALSIHQTAFSFQLDFPTGGSALVAYTRAYERLMQHWRRVLPPGVLFDIEYEQLVLEPQSLSRAMVAHVGLDWDDACLRPELNKQRVKTASKWQARQTVYQDAVQRWRRYEAFLGPIAALIPR